MKLSLLQKSINAQMANIPNWTNATLFLCRYQITSKKMSGMISGVQKGEGEEIDWSDKLPEHTRLSQ